MILYKVISPVRILIGVSQGRAASKPVGCGMPKMGGGRSSGHRGLTVRLHSTVFIYLFIQVQDSYMSLPIRQPINKPLVMRTAASTNVCADDEWLSLTAIRLKKIQNFLEAQARNPCPSIIQVQVQVLKAREYILHLKAGRVQLEIEKREDLVSVTCLYICHIVSLFHFNFDVSHF
jgi:hypothetical protein